MPGCCIVICRTLSLSFPVRRRAAPAGVPRARAWTAVRPCGPPKRGGSPWQGQPACPPDTQILQKGPCCRRGPSGHRPRRQQGGSYRCGPLSSSSSSSSSSSVSSSNLDLLARCVYAEARGEPYTGQVAIAAVVLNRVESPSFPNTISGVIYQKGAFTCVSDGQINLTPNQTAYNAARDALNGWDPTNGCLYYYNPATATSKWIWSLKVQITIGRHSFARG